MSEEPDGNEENFRPPPENVFHCVSQKRKHEEEMVDPEHIQKRARKCNDFLKSVEDSVAKILARPMNDPPSAKDYMDLYSDVYENLIEGSILLKRNRGPSRDPTRKGCTADEVYRSLEKALKKKLKEIIVEGKQQESLLAFYASKFALYKFHVIFLHGMFAYMNRCWVRTINREEVANQTIYSFAMDQWRCHVFKEFSSDVGSALFALIKDSRGGLGQHQEIIKTVVESYVIMSDPRAGSKGSPLDISLAIYCESFEKTFLEQSREFYSEKALNWVETKPVSAYLVDVEEFLNEEKSLGTELFHESTVPKLTAAILDEFIRAKSKFLLSSIPNLISEYELESLRRMFDLLSRLQEFSLAGAIEVFKNDFIAKGHEAVQTFHNAALKKEIEGKCIPLRYVDTLVDVCNMYDHIISICFSNHIEFRKAFDEAAIMFINQNIHTKNGPEQYNLNKTPELLGRYSHAILLANSLIPPEDTLGAINKLFLLLKYTESKDSFEKYYNWNLLNRLINKSSSSDDNEGYVISQMKNNFGQDYSMKSYQLTQDARISDDISRNFKIAMQDISQPLQFDFHIAIFKNGSCKLPECPPINIPHQLTPVMNSFIEYYGKQYEGRTLTWYHNKSFGEIVYNAGVSWNKKYTFTVSVYQMAILLLFNERTCWSLDEMKDYTLIEPSVLTQVLPVLERTKLLMKTSSGSYELYQNYKSNKFKHDINVPIKTEVKTGSEEAVDDEVQNQRNFVLQAVMVRLMKANQTMRHSDLIAETIAAVSGRFKPNVTRIKRTIDCLIEKEYLKRDEEEADRYVYIS